MRQFEFKGNIHTLTEEQYWKLLNRFDEGFAEAYPRPSVESYVIKKPCICDEFFLCNGCPLSSATTVLCGLILTHVMGTQALTINTVFILDRGSVEWQPHQDIYARRLIRKVYKALRRLPYIEEVRND